MTTGKNIIALLKSHLNGDSEQFYSVALQIAAREARQGHGVLAQELKDIVIEGRSLAKQTSDKPALLAEPKGDLANLLSVAYSKSRLSNMILEPEMLERLRRVILEKRQQEKLHAHNLSPRSKLLLVGPPGSGKTMTASTLAGELNLPLFTVLFDNLITRFMGETSSKLRQIFESMVSTRGVYLFDEFDAIGSKRNDPNDVGEIRRILNSFLYFLENDDSDSLIIAATNHPELLDKALFRRFDDIIHYSLPTEDVASTIFKTKLNAFETFAIDWTKVAKECVGLSNADIARAADDAAKASLLSSERRVSLNGIILAISERKASANY